VGRLGAPPDDWTLQPDRINLVGRKDGDAHEPIVDLTPDLFVSRRHAKIWYEKNSWWIEDLAAKGGLVVDGVLAAHKGALPLHVDSEILAGNSLLIVDPPNRHRFTVGDVTLDLDVSRKLNFSLNHCGIPLISRLAARNTGVVASTKGTLQISIPEFTESDSIVALPALAPGEFIKLQVPTINFRYNRIQEIREETDASLLLSIPGRRVVSVSLKVQPAISWSLDPLHRFALAAFVQPNNSVVRTLTTELFGHMNDNARRGNVESGLLPVDEGASSLVRKIEAVYDILREKCQITYVSEERSFEKGCQHIRTPERLLKDLPDRERTGAGTCIDLALLMAACLEVADEQPLIVFVETTEGELHALLGVWREIRRRRNTVIENAAALEGNVLLLESTGVAWQTWAHDSTPRTLTFREALDAAARTMKEGRFVYAVDISAAREDGCRPLP
jgi:hypothetical protein